MTFVLIDLELSVRGDGYIVIPRECIGKIILKNVDIHYSCVEDDFDLRQANAGYISICIKQNCYTDNTRVTYTVAWSEETGDFEGEKRVDMLEDEMIQLRVAKIGLNTPKSQRGIFILQQGFRKGYSAGSKK